MQMEGKTVLVTGATQGIGKVTALELAKLGATVAFTARSPERGEAVVAEIKDKSKNDKVELYVADLAVQAEVRRLADEFHKKHDKLHVLINNAGGIHMVRE